MVEDVSFLNSMHKVELGDHERFHYNKIAEQAIAHPMIMARKDILRCDQPPEDTICPQEYMFHLLGDLRGKTVVDLGCGEGINTVILASLGARVLSVDISEVSLEVTARRARANRVAANVTLLHSAATEIPVREAIADHVFCSQIIHHVDPILTARQIRRILRPGGTASKARRITAAPLSNQPAICVSAGVGGS
jgi:2-polyprenyl-3-methyl-5-hydroxy-6-metoxy-1,4-benzoquinol methylase